MSIEPTCVEDVITNHFNMKKVLITGSSGFIGSHLVDEALLRGYDVYAGIRRTSKQHYLTDPRINIIELDLSDKNKLKDKFTRLQRDSGTFDYIIHNAGITKSNNKSEFDTVNYGFSKNLIDTLIETESIPTRFVYISSLAAIGPGSNNTNEPVTKNDIPHPVSYYGKSKLKTETYIKSLKKFPGLIFRPTGVYGPREKDYLIMYKMINRKIESYIGSDKQLLTFVYIKDLVRLIVGSFNSEISNGEYFVTDGDSYTTHEFSSIVKKILNKKTIKLVVPKSVALPVSYIAGAVSKLTGNVSTLNPEKYKELSCTNWLCDANDTFKDFDFKPEYNLFKGLLETLDWCKQSNLL